VLAVTKQELPDDAGYLVLPKRLGWAAAIAAVVAVATAVGVYHATTNRVDAIGKDLTELKAARLISLGELKAKDVAFEAEIKALRDNAYTRQEAIIGRLARIETILERVEKRTP